MKLQLIRDTFTDKSTVGRLYVNGVYECDTLEDVVRKQKIFGETAIPYGVYVVRLSLSTRFKKILPELIDVPDYTGVRIHSGNTSEDTHGCILVGLIRKEDRIEKSLLALNRLLPKLEEVYRKQELITIEIIKEEELG